MFIVINRRRFRAFATVIIIALLLIGIKPVFKLFFPLQYSTQVQKYAKQNNIDPYLVYAVIKAESNFKSSASSTKGANGLMQLTDETAKWCAAKMGNDSFDVQKVLEPETNISIGCWYISYLLKNSEGRLVNALASYNAGGSNVNSWLTEHGSDTLDADKIPFPETRNYVKKVIFNYKMYSTLYD